jgi:hypothetical protein
MKKKITLIITLFYSLTCLNAQNNNNTKSTLTNYSEQFRHEAQFLVDWNQLSKELSISLNIDLSEASGFSGMHLIKN